MESLSFEILLYQERAIDPQAVRKLYESVDWWPERQEQEIAEILRQYPTVGVWQGSRLIGFARAVTDHRFRAFIEDVVVHPEYQDRGIGRLLLARLLQELEQIDTITLFCRPELIPFYERQGFQVFPKQVVMHRKHP